MKQQLKSFAALVLTATLLFSCSKDDDKEDPGQANAITKIDISVKDGSSHSPVIDQVQVYYYKWNAATDNYEITTLQKTPYNNGIFSINLPATVATTAKDLITEFTEYELYDDEEIVVNTIKVSDNNTRLIYAYLSTLKNNQETGNLERNNATGDRNYQEEYLYVDRDVNIKGKLTTKHKPTNALYTMNYNLRLKKGWNLAYFDYTDSDGYAGETSTTSTAPGVNLEWKFYPNSYPENAAARNLIIKNGVPILKTLMKKF